MIVLRLKNALKKMVALKFNLQLTCKFILPESEEITEKHFNTANKVILAATDINEILEQLFEDLRVQVYAYTFFFFEMKLISF